MPEGVAVETTKRRFAHALDRIANTSQSSLVSSSLSTTPTAKRPATAVEAFDQARDRATKRLRQSTSSSSLPQKVLPASTTPSKDNATSREPPNYSPWSHEIFLARLKTFSSVSLWHPKPEAISEVEWAKRGWICVDVNTVGCRGGCEKRVVVSLDLPGKEVTKSQDDQEGAGEEDAEDNSEFEQALAERYRGTIVEGHATTCLWRQAGCKDDIYHLQVVRPPVWQPDLRKRYQSVLGIRNAIQDVKLATREEDSTSQLIAKTLLRDLPNDVLGVSDLVPEVTMSTKALEVALCGWRGSREAGNELLHCDACFQRIGLWMYQPGYRPAGSATEDGNSEEDRTIDCIEMHRDHCPWRNPATQKASGSLRGQNAASILHRVVSTYARDQRRRSNEYASSQNGDSAEPDPSDAMAAETPEYSKEDVAREDKERESRLRKLKRLFTVKRRSAKVGAPGQK